MAIVGPAERLNQILANQKQIQGGMDALGSNRISGQGFAELGGSEGSRGPSFGDTLKGMMNNINDMQVQSEDLATRFIAGEVDDVHDAMVSMEKASLSFQFMVEVRNRLVEGYQQLMRMQV